MPSVHVSKTPGGIYLTDKKILREFEKSGLTFEEFKHLLKSPKKRFSKKIEHGGKDVLYGVISDSHIGHKCYDAPLMDLAAKVFKREKVDFVLHGGDICEGFYTSRQGHVFELEHIGGDEQVKRAAAELSKIKQPIYAITGNHTWNTFYKMAGIDVGKSLEEKVDNLIYLGNAEGFVELKFGKTIQLLHPDGGTAYAISYRPQKIAESLEGGNKPEIMHIGHFHKAEYIFYRNIHIVQNGCLESQTPFMKGKSLPAHKGFWIIRTKVSTKGISEFAPRFFPAYD